MTNFEYYKDEIATIINNGDTPMLYNGKIGSCNECDCSLGGKCDLYDEPDCSAAFLKWLYAEHMEKPKLTKKERQFCELVETGWIARNKNGDLYFYEPHTDKPYKLDRADSTIWRHYAMMYFLSDAESDLFHIPFAFIKWEDEEPWRIEDLLKLEEV